ncbi:MAG: dihydrolipoamide acetyltransferase family protein [Pseudomonadota bacterium]
MGEYVIKLPDVGEGVAEAELVEWFVAVGDGVKEDQTLGAVMTDKASVEIPSPVSGTVTNLGAEIGDTVAVGAVLLRLDVDGDGNASEVETVADPSPAPSSEPVSAAPVVAAPEPAPASVPAVATTPSTDRGVISTYRREGERPLASPSVRSAALQRGIDLRLVPGSGPIGRITHEDLDAYSYAPATPARGATSAPDLSVEETKVVGLRRKIAERMQSAMSEIPHITIVEEIDVTPLETLRGSLNRKRTDEQPKLTLLPFVMRAIVCAVRTYPEINAHYDKDSGHLKRYGGVHIGIATQTDRGLIVPVVRHCETLDLWDSAGEVARLSSSVREGTADRSDLSGSTITISSLGPYGGLATTPIINSPEMAIVGINKMRTIASWENGAFHPRKVINISCSFDHRFIDGWEAAQFMHVIKGLIESPAELFVGA